MGGAIYLRQLGLCVAVSSVTVLLLVAVGYVPTTRAAGHDGMVAMLAGCGVSWVAGGAGSVVVAYAITGPVSNRALGVLASTGVRFAAVLLFVVPLVLSGLLDKKVFVLWVVLSYLVLLMVDTGLVVYLLDRRKKNET